MEPLYILSYIDFTGSRYSEWYNTFYEAYQRYEDLRTSGKAPRCAIYTKIVYYTRNKAE